MREILHWRENTPTGSLAKDKQLQLELFGYVEQGLTRSKKFYSLWQKSISSLASTQFKYDKELYKFNYYLLLTLLKQTHRFHNNFATYTYKR